MQDVSATVFIKSSLRSVILPTDEGPKSFGNFHRVPAGSKSKIKGMPAASETPS